MNDPGTFFGTINEIEGARVDELRSRLIAISEQCTKLEKRCPAGDELFALFAGSFNLASQPIHVIYIDDNNMVRTNVLLHHRRVTPFLYGQRNVWLVVFAENQLDLMAELTTLWRQGKGSLSRLGGIFVSEGRETVEAREAQTEETPLVLDRLGGAAADDALYYSAGRFFLEPLGVYSTSVFPVESPSEAEAGFVEARANFSNSMSRSLDLGLAQRFDIGEPPPPGVVEKPFDIEDYRATLIDARTVISEANGLVQTTNELLNSPGADRLVPSLVEAINQAGETSEGLVNHAVIRGIFLIVVFLVGLVIARLCYRWLEMRIFGRATVS
mgnify:CR=1 FL=1